MRFEMNPDIQEDQSNSGKTFVVAVTGASGSIYGMRIIQALAQTGAQVLVILSTAGTKVMIHEMNMNPSQTFLEVLAASGLGEQALANIELFDQEAIGSAPASGSFVHEGMVIAPCSMKTLAAVAAGYADNLITRSSDVCLKEKRPLVVLPRETPLGLIHLENMTRLARAGAVILPPSPSFYTFPQTIEDLVDTVVARVLDHLGAEHSLLSRWGEEG